MTRGKGGDNASPHSRQQPPRPEYRRRHARRAKAATSGPACHARIASAEANDPLERIEENKPMSDKPATARSAFGDIAPALADYTDEVLFGDVWTRPGLSRRDRSLITVATLVAL
jgi:alkylhydroperoxidase/carboxymuconolactone decarboxylase family protein YurZ